VNTERIKLKYRWNARFYDLLVRPLPLFERLRQKAVARLRPRPGETVVDLGCGTGLSFELLERGVGPQGRIIGVEITPEMLAKAREKVARHGWSNVTLIEANAEEVDLEPASVDAVLCCLTNDIMHSKAAVERAVRALHPGGRFVATGVKLASGLHGRLLDPITRAYSVTAITVPITPAPWAHLEGLLVSLQVTEELWGTAYIAHGVKPVAATEASQPSAMEVARGS
jgi:demethylmenaquinone methyltransferase/2-methoxy-6-polyprenyl-1,4-benzoquinol methylase